MKYPQIVLKITNEQLNGNAFSVMGVVRKSIRECTETTEEFDQIWGDYCREAMSQNHEHLKTVTTTWFTRV